MQEKSNAKTVKPAPVFFRATDVAIGCSVFGEVSRLMQCILNHHSLHRSALPVQNCTCSWYLKGVNIEPFSDTERAGPRFIHSFYELVSTLSCVCSVQKLSEVESGYQNTLCWGK